MLQSVTDFFFLNLAVLKYQASLMFFIHLFIFIYIPKIKTAAIYNLLALFELAVLP